MEKVSSVRTGFNIFSKLHKAKNETPNNQTSTNPFGVSFKGNVIQADVFETTKIASSATETVGKKIVNKGKMFASAVVGNINNFNSSIKSRLNSVVSFGRKIKEKTAETWTKLANTEVKIDFAKMGESVKNVFTNPYGVNNLAKMPVEDLRTKLIAELAE